MPVTRRVLRLRLRSTRRALAALVGDEPVTAWLLGAALVGGAVWLAGDVRRTGDGVGAAVTAIFLVSLLHVHRQDRRFLRLLGLRPWRPLVAEYLALLAPVAALLALAGDPRAALLALAAAPALAATPTGAASRVVAFWRRRRGLPVPGPRSAFEWRAGLRRSWLVILLLYAFAATGWGGAAGALVVVAILTWLLTSYHAPGEGWPLVQAPGRGPVRFLRWKVGRALAGWGVVVAFPTAVAAVREPGAWPLLALVLAVGAGVTAGAVLWKYASYRPGRPPNETTSLLPVLLTLAMLVPPAGAYLLWRFGRRARATLEPYLHAVD